jgi:mannitol/fructose-specific phosphotransferase system IIA component (Ntr-type)
LTQESPITEPGLSLESLTAGAYIRVGLSASKKEGAIELLLDCLLAEGALPENAREELLECVMKRERRLSTGLESGVAIPHGTTALIDEEVAALGIFPNGVCFDAVDDCDTQIVILLITPARLRHRHVNNLATIARQLLRAEVRTALLAAKSREEALLAIRRGNV